MSLANMNILQSTDILVLDEIGKMELLSGKFKAAVETTFKKSEVRILASIPVPKGVPINLVESLRTNPECCVIMVGLFFLEILL